MPYPRLWSQCFANTAVQTAAAVAAALCFGLTDPERALGARFLGDAFIEALKVAAPFMLFFSVSSSIASADRSAGRKIGRVLVLFAVSMAAAAVTATLVSLLNPVQADLSWLSAGHSPLVSTHDETFLRLVMQDPPVFLIVAVSAFVSGAFLRFLPAGWTGAAAKAAEISSRIAGLLLKLTPLGVFGIVAAATAQAGSGALSIYGGLIADFAVTTGLIFGGVLPLIYRLSASGNPYPLLWTVIRESAFYAFLTRSSIANLPVNLKLAERLRLDQGIASTAISLGAVLHMPGAVVSIVTLSMCAVQSLGIEPDAFRLLLLMTAACLCALAASGIPAGGVMMLPVTLAVLGVDADTAMVFVSIGFVTGVVQDALGTALNSSSDVFLTAAVCRKRA